MNGDAETPESNGDKVKNEDGERQQKEPASESNPSNSSQDLAAEDHKDGKMKLVALDNTESVLSDTDSGLSGSSVTNQSSVSDPSRTDSPLNDNFDSSDFNAFLLSLKRVKTPVEFCDNAEESFNEIDSLISDLKSLTSAAVQASSASDTEAKVELENAGANGKAEPSALIQAQPNGIALVPTADIQTPDEETAAVGFTSQASTLDSGPSLLAATAALKRPSSPAMSLMPARTVGSPDIG